MKNFALALTALTLWGCEPAIVRSEKRAPESWYKFRDSCAEMVKCRQEQVDTARDGETLAEIDGDGKQFERQRAYRMKLEECLRADQRTLDLITEAIALSERNRVEEANAKLNDAKRASQEADRLSREADGLFPG